MSQRESDVGGVSEGIEERPLDGEIAGHDADSSGDEGEIADYDPNESAKETFDRIVGKDEALDVSGDKDPASEEAKKAGDSLELAPKAPKEKAAKGDEFDPELSPPERLNESQRKLFNNLPKGLRRGFHQMVKDVERGGSQHISQAQAVLKEWAPLREAIAPFAQKWGEMGVGVTAGVLQLAAAQARLTDPKEEVREAEYMKMAQRSKVDIVKLARRILGQQSGDVGENAEASLHPVIGELRDQNKQLLNQYQSLESRLEEQRLEREAAPLLSEMEAVRNEKDPTSGRLKYPALHDDAFLSSVKPLVSELVRNDPNLRYGEALRKAHDIRTKQLFGDSFQASQTRPPASNGTNAQRALSIGSSVRGRPAPSISSVDLEIPAEAAKSAATSLEWFMRGNPR